jgi:hypothetical protein
MKTQAQIQNTMTTLVFGLSKRKIQDPNASFLDVLNEHPDIKEQWNNLLREAEELRSKGMWK